jgi:hypothetical protein
MERLRFWQRCCGAILEISLQYAAILLYIAIAKVSYVEHWPLLPRLAGVVDLFAVLWTIHVVAVAFTEWIFRPTRNQENAF